MNDGAVDPFSEHWDGQAWTLVLMPAGMFWGVVVMTGVTAISTSDVWAVGWADVNGAVTHVEHWDGASWSLVPTPSIPGYNSRLSGASGVSPNDVWAVGQASSADSLTLALHWDGTVWTVVSTPSPAMYNFLNSVDALSPNDVWAVGGSGQGRMQTLVEHWDGVSWSVVASPNVGMFTNILESVKAVSANDIWAVGQYEATLGGNHGVLILHWDGAAWSVVPAPSVSPADNGLISLAAACTDDVYAVGYATPPVGASQVLVEHWDGSAWCIAPGPGADLACAAATGDTVWVAGNAGGGTLMARATAGPTGAVADSLFAVKRTSDVDLDWSAGALVPRRYNVHRETAKDAISPPASSPLAAVSSAEAFLDPGAVADPRPFFLYEVYGRDCAGSSIFN